MEIESLKCFVVLSDKKDLQKQPMNATCRKVHFQRKSRKWKMN